MCISKTLFEKDIGYIVECKNCHKILSSDEEIIFQRVLPLPSDWSDINDWFCHGHTVGSLTVEPNRLDLLYSQCLVYVNKGVVPNIITKNDVALCKFCFSWIGLIHKQNTVKLWLNTTSFIRESHRIETEPLSDVLGSIRAIFQTSLNNSIQLILRTKPDEQYNYLLLWILEKELPVTFYTPGEIRVRHVAKVLFKYINDGDDLVLDQWRSNVNIDQLDISKNMMLQLLEHLRKYNKLFSEKFSKTNDFFVSYLFLYD
ncbi:hypothetical protein GWI33_005225 [Rhynchophorus ferrugineus]|uniref:E3 ubiquitin-protein ligase E3D n=1 Tax=Rhynchophorus ferrugineus TaxID=354439 RepID=A0A834MG82_RHYFE|nr:hypothetical protein GWI33_005225 [Rhynchophorus ferrugineus]